MAYTVSKFVMHDQMSLSALNIGRQYQGKPGRHKSQSFWQDGVFIRQQRIQIALWHI